MWPFLYSPKRKKMWPLLLLSGFYKGPHCFVNKSSRKSFANVKLKRESSWSRCNNILQFAIITSLKSKQERENERMHENQVSIRAPCFRRNSGTRKALFFFFLLGRGDSTVLFSLMVESETQSACKLKNHDIKASCLWERKFVQRFSKPEEILFLHRLGKKKSLIVFA